MYVLYAENREELHARSQLFEEHMEPMLQRLETAYHSGKVPADIPEIPQYLKVCRWGFRKLEYAFVLDALLQHLQPGDRFLDAGSGVTPLAQALAARGIRAEACDGHHAEMEGLVRMGAERIYGVPVTYSTQDLTATSFADASFDAISCVSVLEHIPAPHDQQALREMLRILKPGGLLVVTVDFTPPAANGQQRNKLGYYVSRVAELARHGNLAEVGRGMIRKFKAGQVVNQGSARVARSANQCFEIAHLEQDLQPIWADSAREVASRLPFIQDLHTYTAAHALKFWSLESSLANGQLHRAVLPVAWIIQKKPVAVAELV